MKAYTKYCLVALLVFTFILIPHSVFAQPTAAPVDRGEKLQQERAAFVASREAQLKLLSEQVANKRAEVKAQFRENIAKIKDARKKQVVENIESRIENRNGLWVTHWTQVLSRLSGILDKIDAKTAEAEAQGKNVSAIKSSAVTAREAVAAAQAAVDAQSKKTYAITITDEQTLGTNVKTTIASFQSDVKTVINALTVARRSVENVYQAIRKLLEVGSATPKPTATPSATVAPTTQP